MPSGLSEPITRVSFAAMPIEDLCEHHRRLLAAQRDADHWHRLLAARFDLAVASVADLDEPASWFDAEPPDGCAPPDHLRELIGVAGGEVRLSETHLLMQLRDALVKLDDYARTLRAQSDRAARVIAGRVGAVRVEPVQV